MKYRTLGIFSILAGVSFLIINCSSPSNSPSGPAGPTNTPTATPTVTGASTPFWQLVGTAGFGTKAVYTRMIFNNNNPYVIYTDTGNGNKGMVEEYTGSAWSVIDGADFTPGSAVYPSPAFYNNNLYVAYTDSTESNLVTVEEYTSGSWTTIGSPGFGGASSYNSLAFDGNGNPYVAFTGVNYSYLMEYTGTGTTGWVTVGGRAFSTGTGSFVSVAFDSSNNPYVAYGDGYYGGASVAEYVSNAWTYLGGFAGAAGGAPSHVANYVNLVFNGGSPYVAYMDLSVNEADSLVKWSGSSWSNVGSAAFTSIDAFYTSLAFSPTNNNPYVSYEDTTVTDQAVVMEHTGAGTSGWVTVGSPHFSAAGTTYNSLAFDTSGDPYVAYADGSVTGGGKVTVMEYH